MRVPYQTRRRPDSLTPGRNYIRVRKIRVRNSGAGNGCANFMGAWKTMRSFCRKTYVNKMPCFRGWGVFWVCRGGGSADFIFMGAGIFLTQERKSSPKSKFWPDILQTSTRISRRTYGGQELRSGPRDAGKISMSVRTSMTRRRRRP